MINRAPLRITSPHFYDSAILKNVSGFSKDIFLRRCDINQSPSPESGGSGVAIYLTFRPLPSMFEPTRDPYPSGIAFPPHHVKAQ